MCSAVNEEETCDVLFFFFFFYDMFVLITMERERTK